MSLRAILLLLVGGAIAAFVGVNWAEMTRLTTLSLVFTEVQAPLGLILVGMMAFLSVLFVGLVAYQQGVVLAETRRHAKELTAQRELADKAEASRFTELRAHLDQEVAKLNESVNSSSRETLARVDRAEMGLRDRPVDADVARLVQAVESHNRDLHSRVDRLEMGLREGLASYVPPALTSVRHVSLPPDVAPTDDDGQDPIGNAVPR
ncbi:LapA family protein [Ottowia sp.]|uniref:LapA family protein n=1 Tax=Ottowia sp. TaxID=1898956 RepID=UPI003A888E92